MIFEFAAPIIYWRGPAPFVFAEVPADIAPEIKEMAPKITYGWGCLPATVTIEGLTFTTALFPRNGTYYVPIKTAIQRACGVEVGQSRAIILEFAPRI